MAYKINEEVYTIDIENEKGQTTTVSLDANDIAQVDALFTMFESFEDMKNGIDKRVKKLEKEYNDERVVMRQTLRVMTEELDKFYESLDNLFFEGLSKEIFGNKKSVIAVMNFVDMLENEFVPAIEKAQKAQKRKFKEWDEKYTQKDDDLL